MVKLVDMPLEDLYQRDKVTPAALKAIALKEDFSQIQPTYCEKACTMECYTKTPGQVRLRKDHTDILFIQAHPAKDDKWKTGDRIDIVTGAIISFLMRKIDPHNRCSYDLTNVLKCRPIPSNKAIRDATPFGTMKPDPKHPKVTQTVISRCSPYLMEELRVRKPKVIISMSTEVTKSLGIKDATNSGDRGVIQYLGDVPVILARHPSILTMIRQNSSGDMWGPDYTSLFEQDIRKAVSIAVGDLVVPTLKVGLSNLEKSRQIAVTTSLEDVKYWCRRVSHFSKKNKMIISWDTETSGLDPWDVNAKFLMHQFGYRREDGKIQSVVIPLDHKLNFNYDPEEAWPYIAEILLDPDIPLVGHNVAFDILYTLIVKNVRAANVVADTMLLIHGLNSGISGNYSLKAAVSDYLPELGLGGYENGLEEEYRERMKAIKDGTHPTLPPEEKTPPAASQSVLELEAPKTKSQILEGK